MRSRPDQIFCRTWRGLRCCSNTNLDTPYLIAAVIDFANAQAALSVNGEPFVSGAFTGTPPAAPAAQDLTVDIGAQVLANGNAERFNGWMMIVSVSCDRCLTALGVAPAECLLLPGWAARCAIQSWGRLRKRRYGTTGACGDYLEHSASLGPTLGALMRALIGEDGIKTMRLDGRSTLAEP
ncbi:hypothetical protein [Paracoccus mutanolyticus]|uniref:hypothetical protein n=1 Tax=Paracoccus mutanolyticus TaxID=1499308 RepID=UPI0011AE53C2|nr:hypothetical protein [Paracoccus mutanolyticus]